MRILLVSDGSQDARSAEKWLRTLSFGQGDYIIVTSVVADTVRERIRWWWKTSSLGRSAGQLAPIQARAEIAERVRQRLAPDVWATDSVVREGTTAEQILRAVEDVKPDLTVVGARARGGLQRLLSQSVSERVMERAACPVALVGVPMAPRQVMLVVDDVDLARRTLHFLARFPLPAGTTVLILGVLRPVKASALAAQNPHTWFRLLKSRGCERHAVEVLALEARELFSPSGWRTEVAFVAGEMTATVLESVRERLPDLVVLGTTSTDAGAHQLQSAEVRRIVRSAPSPVLVVKTEADRLDPPAADRFLTASRAP